MTGRKLFADLLGTAALAATVLLGAVAAPAADTIKIGGIFDITGATSDVGADYAVAAKDAVAYINANGGINGKKLEIVANDYAYKIPDAVNLYKTYKDDGIFLIQGWGTGDTNALKETVNADQIVYMSASYDTEGCALSAATAASYHPLSPIPYPLSPPHAQHLPRLRHRQLQP